ncbi:hypothetical protein BH20GEM2_BH20GEM2_11430 [soil metagenome]
MHPPPDQVVVLGEAGTEQLGPIRRSRLQRVTCVTNPLGSRQLVVPLLVIEVDAARDPGGPWGEGLPPRRRRGPLPPVGAPVKVHALVGVPAESPRHLAQPDRLGSIDRTGQLRPPPQDRRSMLPADDWREHVREEQVLERVPLYRSPLIVQLVQHGQEAVSVAENLPPLRRWQPLEQLDDLDEVAELAPPVGVEGLPRSDEPGFERVGEVVRHVGRSRRERQDPPDDLALAVAADRVAAGDEEVDVEQLGGQLYGAGRRLAQLAGELGEEVVAAHVRLVDEVADEDLGVCNARPLAVREERAVIQQAAVPPPGGGGVDRLRRRVRDAGAGHVAI